MKRHCMLWTAALAALLAGCSEPQYSIDGKVMFSNGKPAYQGTVVMFTSSDELESGYAVVGADGTFSDVSFSGVGDGVPTGTYSVTVRAPDARAVPPELAATAPPYFGIDPKYTSPETSGLTLEVDGDVRGYEIVLEPTRLKGRSAAAQLPPNQ